MRIYKSENSEVFSKTDGHVYAVLINSDQELIAENIVLRFQDGPAKESGLRNGLQNEEVIAILVDRMKFLNSKVPCRENSIVITKLEEALMWLERRTENRRGRGVEGLNKK